MKILISFGTERFKFTRLCKYIKKLLKDLPKDTQFVVQIGSTPCNIKDKRVKVVQFLKYLEFKKLIQDSDIVIMHAGVGSFLDTVRLQKIPILVPRKPKLKEHLDDQQIQLGETLKKFFNVPVAYSYKELLEAIKQIKQRKSLKLKSYKEGLVKFLDKWVKEEV